MNYSSSRIALTRFIYRILQCQFIFVGWRWIIGIKKPIGIISEYYKWVIYFGPIEIRKMTEKSVKSFIKYHGKVKK